MMSDHTADFAGWSINLRTSHHKVLGANTSYAGGRLKMSYPGNRNHMWLSMYSIRPILCGYSIQNLSILEVNSRKTPGEK